MAGESNTNNPTGGSDMTEDLDDRLRIYRSGHRYTVTHNFRGYEIPNWLYGSVMHLFATHRHWGRGQDFADVIPQLARYNIQVDQRPLMAIAAEYIHMDPALQLQWEQVNSHELPNQIPDAFRFDLAQQPQPAPAQPIVANNDGARAGPDVGNLPPIAEDGQDVPNLPPLDWYRASLSPDPEARPASRQDSPPRNVPFSRNGMTLAIDANGEARVTVTPTRPSALRNVNTARSRSPAPADPPVRRRSPDQDPATGDRRPRSPTVRHAIHNIARGIRNVAHRIHRDQGRHVRIDDNVAVIPDAPRRPPTPVAPGRPPTPEPHRRSPPRLGLQTIDPRMMHINPHRLEIITNPVTPFGQVPRDPFDRTILQNMGVGPFPPPPESSDGSVESNLPDAPLVDDNSQSEGDSSGSEVPRFVDSTSPEPMTGVQQTIETDDTPSPPLFASTPAPGPTTAVPSRPAIPASPPSTGMRTRSSTRAQAGAAAVPAAAPPQTHTIRRRPVPPPATRLATAPSAPAPPPVVAPVVTAAAAAAAAPATSIVGSNPPPGMTRARNVPGQPLTIPEQPNQAQIDWFIANWQPGNHVPENIPGRAFQCGTCQRLCSYKRDMRRHLRNAHQLSSSAIANFQYPLPVRVRQVSTRRLVAIADDESSDAESASESSGDDPGPPDPKTMRPLPRDGNGGPGGAASAIAA